MNISNFQKFFYEANIHYFLPLQYTFPYLLPIHHIHYQKQTGNVLLYIQQMHIFLHMQVELESEMHPPLYK